MKTLKLPTEINASDFLQGIDEKNININALFASLIHSKADINIYTLDGDFENNCQSVSDFCDTLSEKDQMIAIMLTAGIHTDTIKDDSPVTFLGFNPQDGDTTLFFQDSSIQFVLNVLEDATIKDKIQQRFIPTQEFLASLNVIVDDSQNQELLKSVSDLMVESLSAGVSFVPVDADKITNPEQIDGYLDSLDSNTCHILPVAVNKNDTFYISCIGINAETRSGKNSTILLPLTKVDDFLRNNVSLENTAQVMSSIDFFEMFAASVVDAPVMQG